jgi:hypothetical protein
VILRLLKHPKMTDTAVEVLKSFFIKEKKAYSLRVRWWNIGRCHAPYSLNIEQRLTIPMEQWREWELYPASQLK